MRIYERPFKIKLMVILAYFSYKFSRNGFNFTALINPPITVTRLASKIKSRKFMEQ